MLSKLVKVSLLTLLAYLLQANVAEYLSIADIAPSLALAIIAVATVALGRKYTFMMSLAVGYLLEIMLPMLDYLTLILYPVCCMLGALAFSDKSERRLEEERTAENAAADYLKLFRNLYQYADYFTVNISCDNSCREGATHTRAHILRILDPLFDFRRGQNQYRPIMLKVSPDMPDAVIDEISDILLETPLDGIVATNGTHNREGLHTSRTTLDKIGSGRLSGAPLTQRAVEVVRRIHTRSGGNFPIIGVGGIMTPDDAKAMLDAGADLLQLYTGYIYNGPGLVRDICRALVADAEAKAAAERAAAERAAAEKTTAKPAAQQLPAEHMPQPAATAPAPENAENAEPAPAESRTPAQSGPDSEQPES